MMSCSHMLAPNDEELLAHVLGEQALSESGKHHLEHCPTCQHRLKDYQQMHNLYHSHLYRVTCPDASQLTLYCAHALPGDELLAIAEHLHACSLCNEEVREIRREMALFTPFPAAPASLLQQAIRQVRRVVATAVQPVQPALRELSEIAWPRYYQADDLNLSLHLAHASNHQMMLLGIFLASDEERLDLLEGSGAEIFQGEDLQTTVVDRLGHFSFAPVRPGTYTLRLLLPDRELVVEQIHIEE
jgi:hypothetical protein